MSLLSDNREAAQARVDLIQQASHELCISYYIVDRDEIPFGFLALLREAAQRGVVVRLLIDGANNRVPAAVQAYLLREGVAIREFHPPKWYRIKWLSHRMHDKLLISDCRHFITGGRNIKDEYFGHDACENFRDLDIYCSGCAAAEARRYFMCVWNSDQVRPTRLSGRKKSECSHDPLPTELENASDPHAIAMAARLLDESLIEIQTSGLLTWESGFDWSAGRHDISNVWLLHNAICPRRNRPREVRDEIFQLIDRARCWVMIETPYLVLTDAMKDHLAAARKRGVKVIALTNSLATTNHVIAHAEYVNQKRWLLAQGIELWEYKGPLRLHSKAAVIDGRIALVGTYNFDPLSEVINLEVMLAVEDCEFAAELHAELVKDRANSWRIGPDGNAQGPGMPFPESERERIKHLQRLRVVAPLIKRFL